AQLGDVLGVHRLSAVTRGVVVAAERGPQVAGVPRRRVGDGRSVEKPDRGQERLHRPPPSAPGPPSAATCARAAVSTSSHAAAYEARDACDGSSNDSAAARTAAPI